MPSKRISRLVKILSGAAANAEDEILVLENRLERFVHFWVLVTRQFMRNRCFVRASALSYATLIALIPVLVVALSITSSLLKTQDEEKFQAAVEKIIASVTPPADITTTNDAYEKAFYYEVFGDETAGAAGETNGVVAGTDDSAPKKESVVTVSAQKEIARQIWGFVQNTKSKTLGATGVVVLIFVAISLLRRIEEAFNDIWGMPAGRSLLKQIPFYFTAIILGPLLLLAALSLAGGGHFHSAREFIAQTPVFGKLVFQLLPLLVAWLAFALVYLLLTNTRVNISAAAVGAAVAGGLWFLNNIFGYLFVSRVVTNSKIYGSLGLLPVLMVGLYFSWVFLLLGSQIAYVFQYRAAYLMDRLAENVNQRGREFVALRIMTSLGKRFHHGQPPATLNQLSTELGIPGRLAQSVLRVLANKQLVIEVAGAGPAFVPARPLEAINAYDILLALRTGNGQELKLQDEPELTGIYGEFTRIEQAEREAASAITLFALAGRIPAAAALPESPALVPEKTSAPVKLASQPEEPAVAVAEEVSPLPQPEETTPAAKLDDDKSVRREVVRPAEEGEFPL